MPRPDFQTEVLLVVLAAYIIWVNGAVIDTGTDVLLSALFIGKTHRTLLAPKPLRILVLSLAGITVAAILMFLLISARNIKKLIRSGVLHRLVARWRGPAKTPGKAGKGKSEGEEDDEADEEDDEALFDTAWRTVKSRSFSSSISSVSESDRLSKIATIASTHLGIAAERVFMNPMFAASTPGRPVCRSGFVLV